jgi:peptidoglycan/LPS O-acetylase OafA/YrhL
MQINPAKHDHTYFGIQALRFFAAMLVVIDHATAMVGERIVQLQGVHTWRPGMSGVDIFFVISGFVMAMSSRKLVDVPGGWKTFASLRLIRVVPLYWFATTLKIVLVLAVPSVATNTKLDFWQVFNSYFFIPMFDSDDVLMLPVVKVGWTLMYEMLFYTVFAFALFVRKPSLPLTAAVFLICSVASAFAPKEMYIFDFLNPILLEFVMGMVVAQLCLRGITINPWLGGVLALLAFIVICNTGHLPLWWRWTYWGVPAMIIVGVTAMTERTVGRYLPKMLAVLGDSSYSLYLFHAFTLPLLFAVFLKLHLQSMALAVVICVAVSPVVSLAIYLLLERPMTQTIRKLVMPRRRVLAEAGQA